MSVVNVIGGLGASGLLGGSSGSSPNGVSGIVSTVGALAGTAIGGPAGGSVGSTVGSVLGGLLGKEAAKGCFGSQAFDSGDFETHVNRLKDKLSKVNENDGKSVADFLTHCSVEMNQSYTDIGKYRSKCSKEYRQQYGKMAENALNEFLTKSPFEFSKKPASYSDYSGVTVNYDIYEYVGAKSGLHLGGNLKDRLNIDVPKNETPAQPGSFLDRIDPSWFAPGYTPPVENPDDENLEDEYEDLGSNYVAGEPSWGIGGGGRTADGTDWNFGVGKSNDDPTMKYVLLGVLGLVAYKVLFDKK